MGRLIKGKTLLDSIDKNPIEKFHMRVLKTLLGVHKRASNTATLLETGRQPLYLTAKLQAIKYFLRLPSIKEGELLYAYHESEKIHTTDKYTNFVASTLNKIGMGNIWRQQLIHSRDLSKEKNLVQRVRQRMKDMSSQLIVSALKDSPSRLKFLTISKNDHKFETYLNMHNYQHRRSITKLRTSSHKLEVESGRWNDIERKRRICKNCSLQKVEDELHLIFECQIFLNERIELFNVLKH